MSLDPALHRALRRAHSGTRRWTARSCSSTSSTRRAACSGSIEWTAREVRRRPAGGVGLQPARPDAEPGGSERLSLGVAARLSRYLQVLTQAKKMGRETISSQELADYTHVNSTQIRRDLSGFGKFGKRGVGYNVDSLVSQIRKILRTTGKHNIALFGAGQPRPGDRRARTSSPTTASAWWRCSTRTRPRSASRSATASTVRPYDELERVIREEDVVVGVLAVPDRRRPGGGGRPGRGRREDHLQLLRGAAAGAARGDRAHLEPGGGPALRALLLPDLRPPCSTWPRVRRSSRPPRTSRSGSRRSSRSSTRETLSLDQRFEELRDAAQADPVLADSVAGELIRSEIEIRSGRGETFADAVDRQREARARLFALAADHDALLGATGTHPVEPVAGAADHRHRALPARGRTGSSTSPGATTPSALHVHVGVRGADRAVRVCDRLRPVLPELLALSANSPFLDGRALRPALGAHPDLHQELPALRDPGPVRELAGLRGLRRLPGAHELDRRAHPALVERAAAPLLRHGRDADLRRPDERRGLDRAGGADHGLRGPGGARPRRGRAVRGSAGAPDRGELLAGDPLRARRQADRPRARARSTRRRPSRDRLLAWTAPARAPLGIEVGAARGERRPAPAPGARRGRAIEEIYAAEVARDAAHLRGRGGGRA